MLTVPERIELAAQAHREGRIIQHEWRDVGTGGRELVCALAAFGPDIISPRHCPAELMPQWLAELVPVLDDGISWQDVGWFSGELIARARRWHVLAPEAWKRIQTGFRIAGIRQALASAAGVQPDPAPDYWQKVADACEGAVAALDGNGDPEAAEDAVRAAGAAAHPDESYPARSAAWAAQAARLEVWEAEGYASGPAARAAKAAAQSALLAGEATGAPSHRRLAESLFALIDAELDSAKVAAGACPQT